MKAVFEKIEARHEESFSVLRIDQSHFDAPWHFHPECELTWIEAGKGDRFVGDSMEAFSGGDLVLLGSELPHIWKSRGSEPGQAKAVVIHFAEAFPGGASEFSEIRNMLSRARQGLCFSADADFCNSVGRKLKRLTVEKKLKRLLLLLEILGDLADASPSAKTLSGTAGLPFTDQKAAQRINRAYEYIYNNLANEITLEGVARAAGMSPAAFSRYFKRITGRNVSNFIGDLRIGEACKWLRESDLGIAEIAFEVGFGSLSNFNRLFKERQGVSPREWRAKIGR